MRANAAPREATFPSRHLPFVTTLLFALISVVPLHLPGFAAVTPSFALMAVCHWSIYRPDLLSIGAAFVVGVVLDLLNGTPYVGVSALVLLIVRGIVIRERRHFVSRPFAALWLGFVAVAAGVFAFEWGFVSLLSGMVLDTRPFVFQAVLTVACFPVGSRLLARVQRAFLTPA
jgi:rod shape-determining protein MreD